MLDAKSLSIQELNNVGVALCAGGDFEKGIAMLREAQSASPDDPDICCSLGNALGQHGDIDGAVHYLSLAIGLEPRHVAAIELLRLFQPPLATVIPQDRVSPANAGRKKIPQTRAVRPIQTFWSVLLVLLLFIVGGRLVQRDLHRRAQLLAARYLYHVTQVVDDTPEERAVLIHTNWTPPTVQFSPDDMRSIKRFFQINAKNSLATFVGVATVNGNLRAFIQKNGNFVELGLLPGQTESSALAVNDLDDVVGFVGTITHRAVLWEGDRTYDLNRIVVPRAGLVFTEGLNIDNTGAIIVSAIDRHGYQHLVTVTAQARKPRR